MTRWGGGKLPDTSRKTPRSTTMSEVCVVCGAAERVVPMKPPARILTRTAGDKTLLHFENCTGLLTLVTVKMYSFLTFPSYQLQTVPISRTTTVKLLWTESFESFSFMNVISITVVNVYVLNNHIHKVIIYSIPGIVNNISSYPQKQNSFSES
jgi:hypothetical protein